MGPPSLPWRNDGRAVCLVLIRHRTLRPGRRDLEPQRNVFGRCAAVLFLGLRSSGAADIRQACSPVRPRSVLPGRRVVYAVEQLLERNELRRGAGGAIACGAIASRAASTATRTLLRVAGTPQASYQPAERGGHA